MLTSYKACEKDSDVYYSHPHVVGYDYDAVVESDYKAMVSEYKDVQFYEVDVTMNEGFNEGGNYIVFIRTIFQRGDTCIMITHGPEDYEGVPDTTRTLGIWKGCDNITPNSCIQWFDMIFILAPVRNRINSQYVSYRQPHDMIMPVYIIGNGKAVVDGLNGEMFWDMSILPSYLSN